MKNYNKNLTVFVPYFIHGNFLLDGNCTIIFASFKDDLAFGPCSIPWFVRKSWRSNSSILVYLPFWFWVLHSITPRFYKKLLASLRHLICWRSSNLSFSSKSEFSDMSSIPVAASHWPFFVTSFFLVGKFCLIWIICLLEDVSFWWWQV